MSVERDQAVRAAQSLAATWIHGQIRQLHDAARMLEHPLASVAARAGVDALSALVPVAVGLCADLLVHGLDALAASWPVEVSAG